MGSPPNILGISPDTGSSNSDGITDTNRIIVSAIVRFGNETILVYSNGDPHRRDGGR